MSAAAILEALARIEHKLDLVLRTVVDVNQSPTFGPTTLTKVGSASHTCPVCRQNPEYQIDINNAAVIRKCGCSTGKIPLDLKSFAPLPPTKKKDEEDVRDQEDRSDTDNRRGPGRR